MKPRIIDKRPEVQELLQICDDFAEEGVRARTYRRGLFNHYWTPALGSRGVYVHAHDIHKLDT